MLLSFSCQVVSDSSPSNHLILCHPVFLLPSVFPSIRIFSNESVLYITWSKYWSFSFSISLSNEYSGLISFRIHWLDLLAVQGTLKSLLPPKKKSLLQHHSSKACCCCCQVASVVSDSVPPHRRQPTRLRCPWDSPGKNNEWIAISFSNA